MNSRGPTFHHSAESRVSETAVGDLGGAPPSRSGGWTMTIPVAAAWLPDARWPKSWPPRTNGGT
jgi:hypothetical protein